MNIMMHLCHCHPILNPNPPTGTKSPRARTGFKHRLSGVVGENCFQIDQDPSYSVVKKTYQRFCRSDEINLLVTSAMTRKHHEKSLKRHTRRKLSEWCVF